VVSYEIRKRRSPWLLEDYKQQSHSPHCCGERPPWTLNPRPSTLNPQPQMWGRGCMRRAACDELLRALVQGLLLFVPKGAAGSGGFRNRNRDHRDSACASRAAHARKRLPMDLPRVVADGEGRERWRCVQEV